MHLGPESSTELECAATSTTLAAYRYRINFKLAKLAFVARSSSTSSYLNSLVARYLPSRTLPLRILTFSPYSGQRQSSFARVPCCCADRIKFSPSGHQINWQHLYVLSPFKDVLLPQCLQSSLATSPCLRFNIFCWHCARKEINTYLLTLYWTFWFQSLALFAIEDKNK